MYRWLEEQCKSDEEFHFANLILSAPSHIPTFGALRYNLNGGRKELIKDQKVSMSLSTDDSPKVPIILKGFQANGLLSRRVNSKSLILFHYNIGFIGGSIWRRKNSLSATS